MKEKLFTVLTVLIMIAILAGIGFVGYGYYRKQTMEVKNPIVTMDIDQFGTVTMELYPDQAPETVANFITLANRGFYDGLTFHRVVNDFVIQGGDKNGDGKSQATLGDLRDNGGDDEYCIKGEFTANGVENTLKFEEGTLAMARSDYTQYSDSLTSESYNSASSQFFIVTPYNKDGERENLATLNGYYTAFGKVTSGIDVVERISEIEVTEQTESEDGEGNEDATMQSTSEKSKPVHAPKINSVKVETFGVNYGEPHTLEPFDYMTWLYKQYGIDPSALNGASE